MNFIGKNGFTWWIGMIVNTDDPLKMGRHQVRIYGWHSDSTSEIPTEDLPWAQTLLSINGSEGWSNARESELVLGFFTDGLSGQFPVIIGKFGGLTASQIKTLGG